jgi:hypothetical protein
MQRVECYCLFDITPTGVTHNRPGAGDANTQRARNQQRNWDTMLQLASLRTQIFNVTGPEQVDPATSPFAQDRRAWRFSFEIEPESQWLVDGDEFWVLRHDSEGTPMITGLTESPGLEPAICVLGDEPNVIYSKDAK